MRTTKYKVGQEMTVEALSHPTMALTCRERMTETMLRCGTVIWPSVVEAPEERDVVRNLVRWGVRFEVANG